MGQEISRSFVVDCGPPQPDAFEMGPEAPHTPRSNSTSSEEFLTPASAAVASSPTSSSNTVIVFDWDDTLMCSTALNTQRFTSRQLQDLEVAVLSILETAIRLGETLIVTNGNATWVMDSATRFMPNLLPMLERITVVSARARCEKRYPGDPYMWKKVAFEELLVDGRDFTEGIGLNLVALGDQNPEIEAAHSIVHLIEGQSCVTTVKFKEAPTVAELIGQLGRAEEELAAIVQGESGAYLSMSRMRVPSHEQHLTNHASSWKLNTTMKVDSRWSIARALSLKDMWPLVS